MRFYNKLLQPASVIALFGLGRHNSVRAQTFAEAARAPCPALGAPAPAPRSSDAPEPAGVGDACRASGSLSGDQSLLQSRTSPGSEYPSPDGASASTTSWAALPAREGGVVRPARAERRARVPRNALSVQLDL